MSNRESIVVERIRAVNAQSLDRIRNHPFITDAMAGRLDCDQAIRWIMCAGRESRSFPAILENMIAATGSSAIRAILQENLDDEYGHGDPEHAHFRHYLHLLDDLGVPRSRFTAYAEGPGIGLALSLAYNVSRANRPAIALGYMLVNEGMTPITYTAARSALSAYFPTLNTRFFDIHIEVDEGHCAQLYDALSYFGESDLPDLLFGTEVGERGMAALLDEALGLFDHCPELPRYEAA